jgi:hypothetical protein
LKVGGFNPERADHRTGGVSGITKGVVEQGTVQTTNIPIHDDGKPAGTDISMTIERETTLPSRVERQGSSTATALLAPDVVLAGSNESDKFGGEGVAVVLLPGVNVEAVEVQQSFNAAEFNPNHKKYIARSDKAKPMAVNMYGAFWTLIVCVSVMVGVRLFTEPKPDGALHNLVTDLTALPDDGPAPRYKHPYV